MPKSTVVFTLLSVAFLGTIGFSQQGEIRPNIVIVKFNEASCNQSGILPDPEMQAVLDAVGAGFPTRMFPFAGSGQAARKTGARQSGEIGRWEREVARIHVIRYSSALSPWTVAERMRKLQSIEYAEPYPVYHPLGTQSTPDDSLFTQQQMMKTIQAEQAWDITEGSPTIVIGIGDTDIKWDHPDLEANIWTNPGETGTDGQGKDKRSNGVDDDGNGFVDDWHGWDFGGVNGNSPDNDTRSATGGHGTMVAGLAGAVTNNKIGVASIGNRCRILPMKIGPDGGGSLYYTLESIEYASRMGCNVYNASWGGFVPSRSAEDVINLAVARGMVVIGGGGNHGAPTPFYPAAYPAVLDVGVCTPDDIILGESGYGPAVDVMSPADGCWTTTLGNGYGTFGHTSAAAPIVAGLAGLVAAKFPNLSAEQIRERIRVTADNIDTKNPSKAKFAGRGRINAYRALSDPATPSIRVTASQFSDANSDKRFEPGEDISVVLTLKNYLSDPGAPVELTLVPVQQAASVSLNVSSATIPAIAEGASASNSSSPFSFTVVASTNYDAVVLFRVDIKSGAYEDFDFVSVAVNPSHNTMRSNQLSMSIQANGMYGFKDYPDNTMGSGMALGATSTQLYLASAMIGTDERHIVDNARDTQNFLARRNDFRITTPVVIFPDSKGAKSRSTNSFTDAGADSARRLNVEVFHEVFDFSNIGINDVLFSKYTVKNNSTSTLAGLRFSLFMDFGGYPQYYPAGISFDSTLHAGWVTKLGFPVVGTFVIDSLPLSDQRRSTFWAINNDHRVPGNPFGTLDGFTYQERWRAMSSYAGNRSVSSANVAYVLTAPVADIAPGSSAVFVFGHTAATDAAAFRSRVSAAVNLWRNPFLIGIEPVASPDAGIHLAENYPNPVARGLHHETLFPVTLASPGTLTVGLYSLLGVQLRSHAMTIDIPGEHQIAVPTAGLPAGTYILRVTAPTGSVQRSFLLVN